MRGRLLAHEIYDETQFRQTMFKRLVPNLEYIGIFSPRIRAHYDKVGLTQYAGGRNASELTAEDLLVA